MKVHQFAPIGLEYLEIKNKLAKMELALMNQHKQFAKDKKNLPDKTNDALTTLREAQNLITRFVGALDTAYNLHRKDKSVAFSNKIKIAKLEKEVKQYKQIL